MSADDLIMILTPTETNPTPLAENARIIQARTARAPGPADLVFGGDTYYEDFSGALRDLNFDVLVLDAGEFDGSAMPSGLSGPKKKGGAAKRARVARDLPVASFDEPTPRGEFDADIGALLEPSGINMTSEAPHDISDILAEGY